MRVTCRKKSKPWEGPAWKGGCSGVVTQQHTKKHPRAPGGAGGFFLHTPHIHASEGWEKVCIQYKRSLSRKQLPVSRNFSAEQPHPSASPFEQSLLKHTPEVLSASRNSDNKLGQGNAVGESKRGSLDDSGMLPPRSRAQVSESGGPARERKSHAGMPSHKHTQHCLPRHQPTGPPRPALSAQTGSRSLESQAEASHTTHHLILRMETSGTEPVALCEPGRHSTAQPQPLWPPECGGGCWHFGHH